MAKHRISAGKRMISRNPMTDESPTAARSATNAGVKQQMAAMMAPMAPSLNMDFSFIRLLYTLDTLSGTSLRNN